VIVGVDNGLDGGLCAIAQFDGSLIDKIAMPCRQQSKKREIDICKIHKWLSDLNTPFVLAIEEPLAHAKSSQAVRSMAISFGKLLGMSECKGYDVVRVSVHKWQKAMLGYIPKGKTKQAALDKAQELEPSENWLKNKRCRTPHDGMVDAFLIAHYIRERKRLTEV
jgi:hypothetical protein|tara:strand:- start:19 stop:513 length:495 start_codon:yes stop_codon:yes gene_type:complete